MITVVIPVRNREHFIVRSIDSVVSQSVAVDEIIVVDDASTDGTVAVVTDLSKSLDNLKLIALNENVGAARARNIAINSAKGDLIAFLDSDDVWHARKLEKQVKEFDSNRELVGVFCGVIMISSDRGYPRKHICKSHIVLEDLFHSNLLVTMSCALISKSALLKIGGFDESLPSCQDWDLLIRLSEHGKFFVVQEELVDFFMHKGKRISRDKLSVLSGHEAVFERIYARISDPQLKRRVRASHERRMADIFGSDCFEPFQAMKHALKGLLLAPSLDGWRHNKRVVKAVLKQTILKKVFS